MFNNFYFSVCTQYYSTRKSGNKEDRTYFKMCQIAFSIRTECNRKAKKAWS